MTLPSHHPCGWLAPLNSTGSSAYKLQNISTNPGERKTFADDLSYNNIMLADRAYEYYFPAIVWSAPFIFDESLGCCH